MSSGYYGEYKSSTSSETGCLKRFVSTETNSLLFPPVVHYSCDLCKSKHSFGFTKAWTVNTPSQQKKFAEYCEQNQIEQGVVVL